MSDSCRPPEGTAPGTWHWLDATKEQSGCVCWQEDEWEFLDWSMSPQGAAREGYSYAGQIVHPAEVAVLRDEVARLQRAVREAAKQFRHYEMLHRAKPDHAKANVNAAFAAQMEAALTPSETPDA